MTTGRSTSLTSSIAGSVTFFPCTTKHRVPALWLLGYVKSTHTYCTHAHTLCLPPEFTSVSWPVLCGPFTPYACVLYAYMYVVVYLLCVCFSVRPWLPREQLYHWTIPTPHPFFHTHTHAFPYSMASTYSGGTQLVLAGKLVAMMDVLSVSRIQIKIG